MSIHVYKFIKMVHRKNLCFFMQSFMYAARRDKISLIE
jgi:hypothetical protein